MRVGFGEEGRLQVRERSGGEWRGGEGYCSGEVEEGAGEQVAVARVEEVGFLADEEARCLCAVQVRWSVIRVVVDDGGEIEYCGFDGRLRGCFGV